MQNLCKELHDYLQSCSFEDDLTIDKIGAIITYLQVNHDALKSHYRKDNKKKDGSYSEIFVYPLDAPYNGFWTEATPERIREIELEEDYDWSYNDLSDRDG